MNILIKIMYLVSLFVIFTLTIKYGFDKSEIVECKKWQKQAEQYELFYITQYQNQQCLAHNLVVNAPIK